MLIDPSYFVGELQIANSNTLPVQERIKWFINKYEPLFLSKLLGDSLYADFKAGLLVDPVDTQWTALKTGATYLYSDRMYTYSGLVNAAAKTSPIANYVYFYFLRDAATQTTGVGEVKTKPENAYPADSMTKQVRAWNGMVEWVKGSLIYIDGAFPEWADENNALELYQPINTFNL